MEFTPTPLAGAFLIDLERLQDDRGFFARTFCRNEFERHGLDPNVVQCNVSFNERRGTLRGLHYQAPPHEEAKLVSCTSGRIFDVIVDLRPTSPTHGQWFAAELDADRRTALFVPEGFAHGFQTLVDDASVFYQMSSYYHPHAARGIRYDDPAFGIPWPLADPIVSPKDAALPLSTE